MVENAVQHDPDAAGVGSVQQRPQGTVTSEDRVDAIIVVGVIAVISGGLEDRIEVDGRNAKILKIIQTLGHPQ
ncbi:MAG: hypothetical protein MAG451_03012 [Anaerolineales bacterium]|nr:hypothetical protein [Anaerolineales bacterium]